MKKLVCYILIINMAFMCFSFTAFSKVSEMENKFVTVKIPYPEELNDYESWRAAALYNWSGEMITLSAYYDGNVYATVPTENKNLEIKVVIPEGKAFSDADDSDPGFHDVKMLSQTGVIKGNEKGEANINDNITRAEATAMVMRFMGLEGLAAYYTDEISAGFKEAPVFNDVSKKDWFYYVVTYASDIGIVLGDGNRNFLPYKYVTREELTLMLVEALKYAGLRCAPRTVENIADKDAVSSWAKEAYEYIGHSYISDADNSDPENPVRLLNPQKYATRAEAAYMLNNVGRFCQLYPSDLAKEYGFDKCMPVIDGSTSTYPFTKAVYGSLFYNGEAHPQFPLKHSKSHTSYKRLIDGEVDMLFASVYPASDILKYAEEKGVELELIPIAYDAMIFFTNKDNPAEGLTMQQISDIYVNNKYRSWEDIGGSNALLYPYCRNNDSGSHAQMEKHFLNGSEIHSEIKKETSETMSDILTDVIYAKTTEPVGYGLGYSIYYYYNNMKWFYPVEEELKLLEIDGIMPTDETIADGTYPLSNNTYIVLRSDTPKDAPARKMAEFMLTEAGQDCVENAGFGRLK